MAQADITDELIRIKGEERGETVRDSIISAFNKLNSTPGSANSINGYTVKDLVLKEDVADILPLEDELKEFGSRAVKSGAIYNYLEKVDDVLDGILGNPTSDPYSSTSIKNKLNAINTARKQIRGAIIAKQVEVDKDASFRSYADKVKAIPTVAEIQTSEITISENGEVDAGKGKAYSTVTVEAKPKTATKSISKIGTYKAEDDDVEAYSEVTVDISSGVTSKSITAEDLSKDSYETTIRASDEEDKDIFGYSEVSVDVSGKFAELKEEVDPGGGNVDFEFDAKDEELYGYSKVTITVLEISGPFTVEFYDGETKLYTDENVPKNGTCAYKGQPKLEKPGYIFQGWEPNPVDVTKNMKCYATWKKSKGKTDFTQLSWNDIAKNGGIDAVADETTKTIFWKAFEYRGTRYAGGSALARCVYNGEDNTSSTWVFTVDLNTLAQGVDKKGLTYYDNPENLPANIGLYKGDAMLHSYAGSNVANFFETLFLQAILRVEGQEDLVFRNVHKRTMVCDTTGFAIEDVVNCGGLWLLSAGEMGASNAEKNGLVYSGFNGTINSMTRSMGDRVLSRWGSGTYPATAPKLIPNEIITVYISPIGGDYTGSSHLWWNTSVYDYETQGGTVRPTFPNLWQYIYDGKIAQGYLGPVNIGFCL